MKPKVFKWHELWYVAFSGGFTGIALAMHDGGFPDLPQAVKYAISRR